MGHLKDIAWLWACYQAKRCTRGMLFSRREQFLADLRPPAETAEGHVIEYPSAWLRIKLSDVRRAEGLSKCNPTLKTSLRLKKSR